MGLLSLVSPASVVGPVAGAVGNFIVKAFFHDLSSMVEGTVGSFVNTVLGSVVRQTTAVAQGEGNSWFGPVAARTAPVGALVTAPLLMAATLGAVLRQDARRLLRAWGVGLPAAALGGFAAVKLTGVGLSVTDGLTNAVISAAAPNMKADFVAALSVGLVPGVSGAVGVVVSLVVLAGALLVWLELAVRSLAVEVAVFFMPLALAGLVWPSTAHWARRFVEVLVALLLVKPVVAGVLALGAAGLTSSHVSASSLVSGAALLLLAAFAPLTVLKMAPLVDAAWLAHLHELSRVPLQAVQSGLGNLASLGARPVPSAPSAAGADLGLATTLLQQTSEHPLGPARPLAGGGEHDE